MTDYTPPTDTGFDGCNRKCRAQQRHTMEYGRCEHADKPEPTVSMSKICTGPDGYPSIGYDQYTVPQLAHLIEPAVGDPLRAAAAARAIVHRNDGPVVPAVPSPSVEPVLTGTELASLSEGRALARCDRDEALAAVPSAVVDRATEGGGDDEGDELVCVDMCGSCDACGRESFGTPAEGWREAARFLRRTARESTDRQGALHGARLIEAELRRMADEAEYVATPCGIGGCDPGGEPCSVHERLMAHGEGDHELCEPGCTSPSLPAPTGSPDAQAESDTARLAKVVHWVTSEVATAKTEFGNGYREAQRDIRDLIKGRFDNDPKPAVGESGPDEGPRLLFWEESAGASFSDGRVTVPVSRAVNLAEFGPAGDLVLPLQSARTLRDTLSRVLREAATGAPAAGTA